MGLIARHKKPGGFRKLVNSLETTAPDKQMLILETMRKEDPDFIGEVEACIFRFTEFAAIQDMILAEIVDAMKNEPRTLALALHHFPDVAMVDKFKKAMRPNVHFEFKERAEVLKNVLAREQMAAQFRIIETARKLERAGKFTLKRYSPHYGSED